MRQAPQHGVQMPPPPRTPLGSVLRLGAGRGKVGWSSARPRAVPSSCCSLPLIGPTGRTRRLAVLTGNPRGGGGLSGTPGSRGLPVSTAPGNRLATRCPPKRQLPPTRCPQQSPAGGPLGRVASPRPVLLADDLRSREGGAAASGMLDSSVADAMTQLTLKLLEKVRVGGKDRAFSSSSRKHGPEASCCTRQGAPASEPQHFAMMKDCGFLGLVFFLCIYAEPTRFF